MFNQSTDIASIQSNRAANINQTQQEGVGGQAQVQSNLNRILQPSLVSTGLQIAGAGLDYENKMHPYSPPAKPTATASAGVNYSNVG